jgi:uncharacterized YccA/Bax inhibitor family protein
MSNHSALNTFGKSGNPAIRSSAFNIRSYDSSDRMTLDGAVNKTAIMLLVLASSAMISWIFASNPIVQLIGFITAFAGYVSMFATFGFYMFFIGWLIKPRPHLAPKLWLIVAAGQGFFVGNISLVADAMYQGIVLEAVSLTFFVAASLLLAYKSGFIRPTQNFVLMVFAATVGIILFYLSLWLLSLFGFGLPNIISGNSNTAIGFSLFVVAMAAFNLVIDFDIIEQSADEGAPKYMEYFGSMALTITLVWLYIEILRLLMKLNSRR